MRAFLSEIVGTFVLVFVGTGAVIANGYSGGAVTLPGIALAFGLAVVVLVYALGEVSGAHMNPAVTVGLCAAGKFPAESVGPYIACQCLGAFLASLTLRIIFGAVHGLGGTTPAQSNFQAFAMEFFTTFILMLVILCVIVGAKEKGITAGLVIGGVVTFDILIAGPISGASMNPARTLGPALVGFDFSGFWIYWTAPVLGAWLAVAVAKGLYPEAYGEPAEEDEILAKDF